MIEELHKIENYPDYVKNTSSKAILNTNVTALEEYKRRLELESNINNINSEINHLKDSIEDIKSLLISLTIK